MSKRTLKILVVDDNMADVVLISESLREHGIPYTVTHCSDGHEALKLVESQVDRFDLMILDLNMPKLGGLEVLEKIKSTPQPDMPVLVLTSSLVPGEEEEALRLGASRFVRKPQDLDEFLNGVASAVSEIATPAPPVKAG